MSCTPTSAWAFRTSVRRNEPFKSLTQVAGRAGRGERARPGRGPNLPPRPLRDRRGGAPRRTTRSRAKRLADRSELPTHRSHASCCCESRARARESKRGGGDRTLAARARASQRDGLIVRGPAPVSDRTHQGPPSPTRCSCVARRPARPSRAQRAARRFASRAKRTGIRLLVDVDPVDMV